MIENEMTAVIAQLKKMIEIVKASNGPLSVEDKREVALGVTMPTCPGP